MREKRRFAQRPCQLFAQLCVHQLNNTVKEAAQMKQCHRHLNHAGLNASLVPPRPWSHQHLQRDAVWTVLVGTVPPAPPPGSTGAPHLLPTTPSLLPAADARWAPVGCVGTACHRPCLCFWWHEKAKQSGQRLFRASHEKKGN